MFDRCWKFIESFSQLTLCDILSTLGISLYSPLFRGHHFFLFQSTCNLQTHRCGDCDVTIVLAFAVVFENNGDFPMRACHFRTNDVVVKSDKKLCRCRGFQPRKEIQFVIVCITQWFSNWGP